MNLATRITVFRLLLIPVFLLLVYAYSHEQEWMRKVALWVYVCAAISDILDGYIARHFNQTSKLGSRLDPLADKLMISLGFVFLAANVNFDDAVPLWFPGERVVPLWFPVVVVGRDIVIVMGAFTINKYFRPVKVKPRWSGKMTTVFQISTLIGVLLGVWFAPYLILVTLGVSLFSLVDYIYVGCMQAFAEDPV